MVQTLTSEEIERRYKEWKQGKDEQERAWKARLARIAARKKYSGEMKRWLAKRKLEPHDLLLMYKDMAVRRRADQPVKSKKPLRPTLIHEGRAVQRKGDAAFRAAIRKARLEKGWTHGEVGTKLGVSYTSINNWENGRYVPKEAARAKICKLFGLPADMGKAATETMEATVRRPRKTLANGEAHT